MQKGAKINVTDNEENTIIHIATEHNHHDVVSCICALRSDIDINARNKIGQRPLHYACKNGCKRLVRLLLKYGADPEARCVKSFV